MKKLFVAATLLASASAAQAGFITMDSIPQAGSTIDVVSNNEFKSVLDGIGVKQYTLGASLATDVSGTVSFFYYGKEAGYNNQFKAGAIDFSTGYSSYENKFGAPSALGSMDVDAGLLNFSFCAFSSPGSMVGCVSNAQNDAFGMSSFQSIAMSVTGDTAWLFWDDSGAGPDDNHDDMLIKAVFTPVPEPSTFALFALGLLGVGMSRKLATKTIK